MEGKKLIPWMRIPNRMRTEAATRHAPLTSGLTGRTVREYGANYSNESVAEIGQEDGNASLNDSGVWGANAKKVWAVRMLRRGHRVNMHLIGHQLRDALLDVYRLLDHALPRTQDAEQQALDAVDERTMTAIEKENKRQEIKAEGLAFPHWLAHSALYTHARSILTPAIIVGLLLSGCGGITTKRIAGCGAAQSAPGNQQAPVVAALVPVGSDSATASTIASTINTVTAGAKTLNARFVLNGIGVGLGAPNLLVNTEMVADGPNPLMRKTNLECKTKLIIKETEQLSKNSAPATLDTISALSNLRDDLKGIPGQPIDVVVTGSAQTRTQLGDNTFLDLRDPAVLRSPVNAINQLAKAGLNFRCDGWRITWVGGSTDTSGKPLSAETDSEEKAFWRMYFQHCGGTLVAYSPQIAQFPVPGGAIEPADVQIIRIPVVRTPHTIKATLDSKVLFDISSAVLRAGADNELRQILPLLSETKGEIDVAGYTDDTGNDAINRPLSQARAATVATWLERNAAVPAWRLRVLGFGSRDPVRCNCTASGRAKNRRVVVTIHR